MFEIFQENIAGMSSSRSEGDTIKSCKKDAKKGVVTGVCRRLCVCLCSVYICSVCVTHTTIFLLGGSGVPPVNSKFPDSGGCLKGYKQAANKQEKSCMYIACFL